jgi:uncharacterized protein YdcH (DUF465 family)
VKEMNEKNELKDKIESTIMYKPFTANVPYSQWKEQYAVVDTFCKENFMDNRWSMIWTLVNAEKDDYKFAMLFDKLNELEEKLLKIQEQPVEEKRKSMKTFGQVKE